MRFWRCPEGWLLPGGFPVDWLAAATFDRKVGLSLFTLQVTHKIEENTDVERDFLIGTITDASPQVRLEVIENFSSGYHARNGGGDRIRTDGDLPILALEAVEAPPDDPTATPTDSRDRRPAVTDVGAGVALLRALAYVLIGALALASADGTGILEHTVADDQLEVFSYSVAALSLVAACSWTPSSPSPCPRAQLGAAVADGRVDVRGGHGVRRHRRPATARRSVTPACRPSAPASSSCWRSPAATPVSTPPGTGPRGPAVGHVTASDRRAVTLVVAGGIAALLYANFLIDWVLRGFAGMGDVVSELESAGQPNAVLLRVTDVLCAVLVVALLPWVRAGLPRGAWREVVVWSTVLFAAGATVAAIVATPCGPDDPCTGPGLQPQLAVHDWSSILSDTALYVGVAAAWFATRVIGPAWFRRTAWWLFWVGGVVSSAVVPVRQQHRRAVVGGRGRPAGPHRVHLRLDRHPVRVRRHRRHPRPLAARPDQRRDRLNPR